VIHASTNRTPSSSFLLAPDSYFYLGWKSEMLPIELLSDSQNTPYSAAQQASKLAQQIKQYPWSAEQVAKVIQQTLSDRDPKPRYVAATVINKLMLALCLGYCPLKLQTDSANSFTALIWWQKIGHTD
jgi:hypothetical protein